MQDILNDAQDFLIRLWVCFYQFLSRLVSQDPDDGMMEELNG